MCCWTSGVIDMQVGICGVGISSVLSGQGSASADITQSQIMLGMALIVCSQVKHYHLGCIALPATCLHGTYKYLTVCKTAQPFNVCLR